MLEKREFYINGQWVAPASANDLDVINPSNEEPCAVISLGGQADTDAAVRAAGDAFDGTAHPRDTVECLRVLAGNLDVTVGGTHMVGAPGDTIAFEAHEPHRYAASGDSPVRFTMWITVGDVGGLPSVTAMGSH